MKTKRKLPTKTLKLPVMAKRPPYTGKDKIATAKRKERREHMWRQITAPHFCSSVNVFRGSVWEAAPILQYMVGWKVTEVKKYCQKKGWKFD